MTNPEVAHSEQIEKSVSRKVYDYITDNAGDREFTSVEIASLIDCPANAVSAALCDLRKRGCVEAVAKSKRAFIYRFVNEVEKLWKRPADHKITKHHQASVKKCHKLLNLPNRNGRVSPPEEGASEKAVYERLFEIVLELEAAYLNPDLSRVSNERLIEELRSRNIHITPLKVVRSDT